MAIKLDPEPCNHPPGSREKMARMAWRLQNGYSLTHPDDTIGLPKRKRIRGGYVTFRGSRRRRCWQAILYLGSQRSASGWRSRFQSLGFFSSEEDASAVLRMATIHGVDAALRMALEHYGGRSRHGEMGRAKRYRAQIHVGGRLRFIARCETAERRSELQCIARERGIEEARKLA